MSDIERQVLQLSHVDLLRNLKVDSDILGILYKEGILTEHMVQIIQVCITLQKHAFSNIPKILPRKNKIF